MTYLKNMTKIVLYCVVKVCHKMTPKLKLITNQRFHRTSFFCQMIGTNHTASRIIPRSENTRDPRCVDFVGDTLRIVPILHKVKHKTQQTFSRCWASQKRDNFGEQKQKKSSDPLLFNLVIILGGVSMHLFTRYSLILIAHCMWKNDNSGTLNFHDNRATL